MNKKAILCDLDGCLAIFEGRRKWHEFHLVGRDKVRESVKYITNTLSYHTGCAIIIVTGRPESCRKQTEQWLSENDIRYDLLIMRVGDDDRPDHVVKREIYEEQIKPHYKVAFVIDDRNSVVQMYRDIGLDCFQIEITDY